MARNTFRKAVTLLKEAFSEWQEDNASRLAAALAYYTTFSIAPLLVLIIAIAGLLGGHEAAHSQVLEQVGGLVGEEGKDFVESMLTSASKPRNGLLASAVGIVALLFGALGVFSELQNSLNTIWEVKPRPVKGLVQSMWRLIRQRILSFSMVLAISFVLLASLVVNAVLSALGVMVLGSSVWPTWLTQGINLVVSFFVITLLFALIFKFMPDAEISWGDIWLGAVVTSLLFNLGKLGIGFYLGRSSLGSTFGAAGSLAILLIWVFYSAQIFFFGAEVTQVYANNYGSRILPDENAVKITEIDRSQEGIPHREVMKPKRTLEDSQKIR
jgi:membrane protein